jgi:hypothetical protein
MADEVEATEDAELRLELAFEVLAFTESDNVTVDA